MSTYLLTVQIKMKLRDDIEVRSFSKAILSSINIKQWENKGDNIFETNIKLQEIYKNSCPRKVEL